MPRGAPPSGANKVLLGLLTIVVSLSIGAASLGGLSLTSNDPAAQSCNNPTLGQRVDPAFRDSCSQRGMGAALLFIGLIAGFFGAIGGIILAAIGFFEEARPAAPPYVPQWAPQPGAPGWGHLPANAPAPVAQPQPPKLQEEEEEEKEREKKEARRRAEYEQLYGRPPPE